ncbi:hypothetical protein [Paenibacillus etheri]|uniref:Uncharacterized protein n=1 Tax=Paenibacillus etheri TaxID=1306852 RepID=A0A0W1ASF3_9BACL|nr:hypothetical protein [Paenibacillus etheri]KTD84179.1 hypothetical protein UQ64_28895 [Paenibacillus etheri]
MCKVDEVLIWIPNSGRVLNFNKSWVIEHIRSPPFYIPELAFIAYANHELAGYLMFSKLIIRENGIPPTVFVCGHTDFYQEIGFVPHVGVVGGKKKKRYWHMS